MNPAPAILALAALLLGGTLTYAEALEWTERPRWARAVAGSCRTLVRGAALAAVLFGLLDLIRIQAALLWDETDAFLLRAPQTAGVPSWTLAWLQLAGGLLLALPALPPVPCAAIAGCIAFAEATGVLLAHARLPLGPVAQRDLLALALAIVVPAAAVSAAAAWRGRGEKWEFGERTACKRVNVCLSGAVLVIGLLAPAWLHESWPNGLVPTLLVSGVAVIGIGLVMVVGFDELPVVPGGAAPPSAVVMFGVGLLQQRRVAWRQLTAVVCLLHLALVGGGTARAVRDGRRLLNRVAAQPELLCGRPDPSRAEWEQVADRMESAVRDHQGHRWCGQWLLVSAWIHSTRLHNSYRAWLLLNQVKDDYRRCRAAPPVGWPDGRSAGAIADRVLSLLGASGGPDASVT